MEMSKFITLKISREDWVEGIKRHPEFIKDFEKFMSLKKEDGALAKLKDDEIWDKWGIHITYCLSIEHLDESYYIDNCVSVVRIIHEEPIMISCWKEEDGDLHFIPHVEQKGDRLYIKVDIRVAKKIILKKIEEKIDEYKEFYPTKKKNKATSLKNYDKWKIYDLHHVKKMKFVDIARNISGINKPLSDSDLLNADYQKVLRAYKKSKKIITEINHQIELNYNDKKQ